jgi:hypothetical protein
MTHVYYLAAMHACFGPKEAGPLAELWKTIGICEPGPFDGISAFVHADGRTILRAVVGNIFSPHRKPVVFDFLDGAWIQKA